MSKINLHKPSNMEVTMLIKNPKLGLKVWEKGREAEDTAELLSKTPWSLTVVVANKGNNGYELPGGGKISAVDLNILDELENEIPSRGVTPYVIYLKHEKAGFYAECYPYDLTKYGDFPDEEITPGKWPSMWNSQLYNTRWTAVKELPKIAQLLVEHIEAFHAHPEYRMECVLKETGNWFYDKPGQKKYTDLGLDEDYFVDWKTKPRGVAVFNAYKAPRDLKPIYSEAYSRKNKRMEIIEEWGDEKSNGHTSSECGSSYSSPIVL